jgi:hypothetical protein
MQSRQLVNIQLPTTYFPPTLRFLPSLRPRNTPSAIPHLRSSLPPIMFDNIDFTQPSLWGKLPHAPVAAMTLAD